MRLNEHWIRRGVAIVVGFRLCTLDGIIPRGGNTRPIQRRLGLLDDQPHCHVGVVSAKTQTRACHRHKHFCNCVCFGRNDLFTTKTHRTLCPFCLCHCWHFIVRHRHRLLFNLPPRLRPTRWLNGRLMPTFSLENRHCAHVY